MDIRLRAACCATLLFSNLALADGTVSDGIVTLNYTTPIDIITGTLDVTVDGTSHFWAIRFFYRVDGDLQEFDLGASTSESYVGNVATLTWTDVDTRGLLDIEVTMTVTDLGGGDGALAVSSELTNISGGDITADFFVYVDADLDGSFGNDSAVLVGPGQIEVTDVTVWNFNASTSDAFQVDVFPVIRGLLDDGGLTDLDDSGLPFGPGDISMAFQWADRVVPNGGSLVFALGAETIPGPVAPPPPPAPAPTPTPTPAAEPPQPVPVLPGLFYGLLAFCLGGMGMRQLRRARRQGS